MLQKTALCRQLTAALASLALAGGCQGFWTVPEPEPPGLDVEVPGDFSRDARSAGRPRGAATGLSNEALDIERNLGYE